jgi:hypothetical protein
MRKILFFFFILFFSLLSDTICSQTDSLDIHETNPMRWYFGSGIGVGSKGGVFELSFTMASSNFWGGSLNFRTNMAKSDNVPTDYYDDGLRVISPKDYLSVLSFNFLKKFEFPATPVRFGFETGPAWVRYNLAEFEANSNYDPNYERSSWDWGPPNYLYLKSHEATSTIGFSIAAKTEFPFKSFFSMELTVYTVLNNIQSVVGLDICLNLGKIRNERTF